VTDWKLGMLGYLLILFILISIIHEAGSFVIIGNVFVSFWATFSNYQLPQIVLTCLPYSLPTVGPGADPSVQAVSQQVTFLSRPGGRLPLLSARPVVSFPAEKRHRPSTGTKLYCLMTEAHGCE